MHMLPITVRKILTPFFVGIIILGTASVGGCNKDNNPVNSDETIVTTDDAADAVSDALASNNGGAMDQVEDVFEIAGGTGKFGGTPGLGKGTIDSVDVRRLFDSVTTSWTLHIYKERSGPFFYGNWTRDYWHQFRANGTPQISRVVGTTVADTILHKITGGTGYFWTPRLSHKLDSLRGDWVASNTNTDTVTINGTYKRWGVDTIKVTARKGRYLVHSLSLIFKDVRGPRGSRRSDKTSGTIEGTYKATVTVTGRASFEITKTFIITLGSGKAVFSIDGTKYTADLDTGDH